MAVSPRIDAFFIHIIDLHKQIKQNHLDDNLLFISQYKFFNELILKVVDY
jgi:hypothetical protein